jgi:hypothetical protein
MTEEQKAPFIEKSRLDAERYIKEKREFQEALPEKLVTTKLELQEKPRSKSIDAKPTTGVKKPIVAYMFFIKKHARQVMLENKEICKTAAGATKILGKKW